MMDHCIAVFKKKHGKDLSGDKKAIARIRRQCEMAKRTLSTQKTAQIEVGYVTGCPHCSRCRNDTIMQIDYTMSNPNRTL